MRPPLLIVLIGFDCEVEQKVPAILNTKMLLSQFSTLVAHNHSIPYYARMVYNIPQIGELTLNTLILDLNGTLTVRGVIPDGVKERLATLKEHGYRILFLTGNTRNNADEIASSLGIEWMLAETGAEKRDAALALDPNTCVSIGNGLIDLELMQVVRLGIVTLQAEGVHVQTMLAADIVVPSILDALDLLIDPATLVATLRK